MSQVARQDRGSPDLVLPPMSEIGPKASVRCVAVVRPKSGVKQTCRHRSNDAIDPKATCALLLFGFESPIDEAFRSLARGGPRRSIAWLSPPSWRDGEGSGMLDAI